VKPGVSAAMASEIDVAGASLILLFQMDAQDFDRPFLSGRSTSTWRSKRPARSSAGSRISGRLVAASRTTAAAAVEAVEFGQQLVERLLLLVVPASRPAPRARPSASSSSMKMMQGAALRACSNRSRTRAAPTPTNISTNSEPEIEKNGTPASPATARASSVLPVPGGPTSRMPRGHMRAEPAELVRPLQEIDDLVQLFLGLVDAGDVVETHLHVGFGN
jgi:hypothetical protein